MRGLTLSEEIAKNLLLVEDELLIAMSQKKSLEKYGYNVLTANSCKDALDVFKNKDDIDLILMDIDLGTDMDGTEAARIMLNERDIPIVFLSSHTEPDIVKKTEKITSYGYVVKNSGITVLDASIKMAFKLFYEKIENSKKDQRIRDSENKYRSLFSGNRDGIVFVDVNERFIDANPSFCEMTGYSLDELRFMETFYTITPDRWREWEREEIWKNRLMKTGYSGLFEKEYIRRDGTIYPVELHAFTVKDRMGKIEYIWAIVRDITERRTAEEKIKSKTEELESTNEELNAAMEEMEAANAELIEISTELQLKEKALIESETKYRMLIDNSHDTIFTLTPDGIFTYISPSWTSLLGYQVEDVIGKPFLPFIHPEDVPECLSWINKINESGEKQEGIVYRARHADGTWYWHMSSVVPLKNEVGEITGVEGIARDITEYKLADLEIKEKNRELTAAAVALRESEERFRNMFENHSAVMLLIDPDTGRIVDSNQSAVNFYGYDKSTLESMNIDAINIMPREKVRENYTKAFTSRQNFFEFPHKLANGETRIVEVHSSPIKNQNGNLLFSIIHDITDRKQSGEKIKSLLDEKELILKEVHHRIKNFMNTIKGLIFLQAEFMKNSEDVSALHEIESQIDSMMVLYDRLYKADNFMEISIIDFIPGLVDGISSHFPKTIPVTINKNIADFVLDAKRLQPIGIIINELITNSMKYAFTGRTEGTITISAVLSGSHVTVTISDDGIGLPETVSLGRSSGFGMQLVSMLAEQIEAAIKVERGEGTAFILEFEK